MSTMIILTEFNNTIMYITNIIYNNNMYIFFIMALKKYQMKGNDLYNINRYIEIVIMIIIFIYILVRRKSNTS